MSTRSGKRIHNSFHETTLKPVVEQAADSERKTRSRRLKENVEETSVNVGKIKKRANYVSYPTTDEEVGTDTVDCKEDESKPIRLPRRNALKEQNLVTSSTESDEPADFKKATRFTRRTHKFAEDLSENVQEPHNEVEEEIVIEPKKSKKAKKKAQDTEEKEVVIPKKKTTKKGKKGRRSSSMIVENIEPRISKTSGINRSNISNDSFHSAAGSPPNEDVLDIINSTQNNAEVNIIREKHDDVPKSQGRQTRSATRLSNNILPTTPNKTVKESRKRKSSTKEVDSQEDAKYADGGDCEPSKTFKRAKNRRSIIKDSISIENPDPSCDVEVKNSSLDLESTAKETLKNTTFDKTEAAVKLNSTYDKDETVCESMVNTTFDKKYSVKINTTFDKECDNNLTSSGMNAQTCKSINKTFEKSVNNSQIESVIAMSPSKPEIVNTTFDKDEDCKTIHNTKESTLKNTMYDKILPEVPVPSDSTKKLKKSVSSQKLSTEMNSTFDKNEQPNSTYDKDKKLDVTFDKNSKSSLISSDNSILDKSNVSRISITSDESKENIVNMTPVLVESSLDESSILSKPRSGSPVQAPLTPLKREGTFTKDQEVPVSIVEVQPPSRVSRTPTKQVTLPSPGLTPFHLTKSSSQEKSIMNVTRSIEKSRRSSLAEPLPRTTKVMFCSPVNDPIVVMQQRGKVIKSNLKGSNKSFVFEESGGAEYRPTRKRSYTHSDADDARAKRKRLQDGLQHSVDRLARPRTTSATAKFGEPSTPSKKPVTPKKEGKVSRTKLPNFAVLHQKQFDKMESLDECQERKAKRAKHLLTPTGAHNMLERISPRENTPEPQKSTTKDQRKDKKAKEKPETPVKSLPTLKSLNPGYTRFGFKLNLDVNPFSVVSKNDSKVSSFSFSTRKESKPKVLFTFSSRKEGKRDNTKPLKDIKANLSVALPSLAGATSARRETAKQTVMREKSFTDRRNTDRNENRTVIKGVRTNRRFELQMRMRNID